MLLLIFPILAVFSSKIDAAADQRASYTSFSLVRPALPILPCIALPSHDLPGGGVPDPVDVLQGVGHLLVVRDLRARHTQRRHPQRQPPAAALGRRRRRALRKRPPERPRAP